jgi:hypothetical protein
MIKKALLLMSVLAAVGFAYYKQPVKSQAVDLPMEQLVAQNDDAMFDAVDFSMKPMTKEPAPMLPLKENYTFESKDGQDGKELSWEYRGERDFKVKGTVDVQDSTRLQYRSLKNKPLSKAEVRFSNGKVEIYTKGEVDEHGKSCGSFGISGKFP